MLICLIDTEKCENVFLHMTIAVQTQHFPQKKFSEFFDPLLMTFNVISLKQANLAARAAFLVSAFGGRLKRSALF